MIRTADKNDFDQILALNLESEHFLSPMDKKRLTHLHECAAYHRVVETADRVVAFLLAFCKGADYDSPNYQWFSERFAVFLYIDRIVVSKAHQRRHLGGMLYDDLFEFARRNGLTHVTCEYDVDPPNETSRRFHERYGFEEVGSQWVEHGKKRVSLQRAKSNSYACGRTEQPLIDP